MILSTSGEFPSLFTLIYLYIRNCTWNRFWNYNTYTFNFFLLNCLFSLNRLTRPPLIPSHNKFKVNLATFNVFAIIWTKRIALLWGWMECHRQVQVCHLPDIILYWVYRQILDHVQQQGMQQKLLNSLQMVKNSIKLINLESFLFKLNINKILSTCCRKVE